MFLTGESCDFAAAELLCEPIQRELNSSRSAGDQTSLTLSNGLNFDIPTLWASIRCPKLLVLELKEFLLQSSLLAAADPLALTLLEEYLKSGVSHRFFSASTSALVGVLLLALPLELRRLTRLVEAIFARSFADTDFRGSILDPLMHRTSSRRHRSSFV